MLKTCVLHFCLLFLASALTCPDSGLCDNGNTCCQTASGVYGCCPIANAECCEDHLHCCYAGMLCDLERSQCSNDSHILPWLDRVLTKVPVSPQSLSCIDGLCCPDGHQHSDDGTSCTKKKAHLLEAVICPDGESECPDETTCCQLPDSSWGCCPMAKAVCCEDRRHCCPQGTKCDITHSKCLNPTYGETAMLEKFPARRRASSEDHERSAVTCSGNKSQCPEGTTCCQLPGGHDGCCPFPDAVCCTDHLHCCPRNTTCDLEWQACWSSDRLAPLSRKFPAAPKDVICPDVVSRCPDEMTCCQLSNGSYGCCPMPRAVCCSDFIHCCPDGTACDLVHSICVSPRRDTTVWATKLALQTDREAYVIPCNDTVACPDNTTCCKTGGEQWACCPFPEAVCCDDHIHCCPHGFTCNVAASTCDSHKGPVPWRERMPAQVLEVDEKCDEQTVCSSGTTCCRQNSGEWACCPLPHAVCCDDHEHCCPKGYKCDVSQKTCNKPGAPGLPWARKVPAQTKRGAMANVSTAPWKEDWCDPHTSCPKDNTCCYMNKVGRWGCCPLPKAVCCKDGDHCCPSGYQCDQKQRSCIREDLVIGWYQKEKARSHPPMATDVKCDTQSSCPTGTTCCPLPTGQWGCCPLVEAVCCADHEHCCPQGYTCNMKSGTCEKEMRHELQKIPTSPLSSPDLTETQKVDTQCSGCSEGETCCQTSHTSWACCPLPEAVCCSDMKLCCPAGYTCDLEAGSCTRPNERSWDLLTGNRRAIIPV